MLCEKCKKNAATVFYKENVNGKVRALNLCPACAEQMRRSGELEDFSSAFTNFTSPFGFPEDSLLGNFLSIGFGGQGNQLAQQKTCPGCGCTLRDIRASGMVGCASCYEAFAQELRPVIESAHGSTAHIGRSARGHRAKREKAERLATLKRALKDAVNKENYEEAATLRDRIRDLENGV